jgi:hypothetical protein
VRPVGPSTCAAYARGQNQSSWLRGESSVPYLGVEHARDVATVGMCPVVAVASAARVLLPRVHQRHRSTHRRSRWSTRHCLRGEERVRVAITGRLRSSQRRRGSAPTKSAERRLSAKTKRRVLISAGATQVEGSTVAGSLVGGFEGCDLSVPRPALRMHEAKTSRLGFAESRRCLIWWSRTPTRWHPRNVPGGRCRTRAAGAGLPRVLRHLGPR